MKITLTLVAAIALGGCALAPKQKGWTIDDALAEAPIVCSGAQQCSDYWRRTQYWISTHSGFKIQMATDTVIETFNPPDYSQRWAYSARREPGMNGQDMIHITPSCGRFGICSESPSSLVAEAKAYVAGQ